MKKQSDLSRLMGYAGNYRYFTYASWVLSGASALVALVPFVYIWKILRDVLNAAPDYAQAVNIPYYGWMAVLFAVFLCIKRREVRRTRLLSTLCVPLHPSA